MLKKRIKLLAAMVAIVIIVASLPLTNAKFTGSKTLRFNMSIEPRNGSALHGEFRDNRVNPITLFYGLEVPKVNGSGNMTCNLLWETNNVTVSLSGTSALNSCLKITTVQNSDAVDESGNDIKICMDPYIELNFVTSFKDAGYTNGMPYKIDDQTIDGISTDIIKYIVISYYIPATKTIPARAYYNTVNYSVRDYNHLRVYTSTTANDAAKYGTYRFISLSDAFSGDSVSTVVEGKGSWVTEIIDLEAVNLRGITQNDKNTANGYANWEGYLYGLRIDIGQVGGFDAWFNNHTKHDCPEGKSVYIKDIMFFNSYYRAARAMVNLHNGNVKLDPTTFEYSTPIEVDAGNIVPVTTIQSNIDYVDISTDTEDTVEEPSDW